MSESPVPEMSVPEQPVPEQAVAVSPQPPVVPVQSSTMAILSLIFAILSWVGFLGIGAILAIIFGHLAKNEIKKSGGLISGDGMATAGLVLGYTHLALVLIGFCLCFMTFAGILTIPLCMIPFSNLPLR